MKLRALAFFALLIGGSHFLKAQNLLPLTDWKYINIDHDRGKWGDWDKPDWLRYFGLDMKDVTGDGMADIIAGRYFYINPGGKMDGKWKRTMLPQNADGILFMDVDGDDHADIIAQALPNVIWFEAEDNTFEHWKATVVGQVPPSGHVNSQGFERGQFVAGGKEEFVIAGGAGGICMFEIPKNPEKGNWPMTVITENTSDEGIGVGDIDGDGKLDIAAGRPLEKGGEPLKMVWFKNPGKSGQMWKGTEVGPSNNPIDRIRIADVNGDKKADIVMTEERYPGLEPDGNMFWFEQPASLDGKPWDRHHVVTQYSMNNLDVADMDNDGDIDLVTCEQKGPRLQLQLWENDSKGNFVEHVLDSGKESHLGTQLFDLDGDGDLDIVSPAWDNYKNLHLWRNDAINPDHVRWKLYSSANGDMPTPNSGKEQTSALVLDIDKDGVNDFVISERTAAPALVWYKKHGKKWDKYVVNAGPLRIEAGSAAKDIDGDGDLDIVFGGESQSNEVWWWENPYPNYNPDVPWKRYTIKKSGATKHHDQMFGDFDGDGKDELVFWNQGARTLFIAEIPPNPKSVEEWDRKPVYQYSGDSEMYPRGIEGYPDWKNVDEQEGLAKIDIDGDGILDIVGGGRWFKYDGKGGFIENIIDASYVFTRAAAGDFIEGGRPEVLLVVGDGVAPIFMYQWVKGIWVPKQITGMIDHGHTIGVVDFNHDGHLDIFSAEMRFGEGNPDAKTRVLLGDGKGNFTDYYIATGYGVHQGVMADLDGDGDLDVLGKPYSWDTPRMDLWINEGH